MNYYEHHIGDYAEATSHLTFVEDAAYSRLIRKYYATEKPLPSDVKHVQRLINARTRDERNAVALVLNEFFILKDDGWHQARCDHEVARFKDKQTKAKRSAETRWQGIHAEQVKNGIASDFDKGCKRIPNAIQTECSPVTNHHTPISNHQTPYTSHQSNKDIRGKLEINPVSDVPEVNHDFQKAMAIKDRKQCLLARISKECQVKAMDQSKVEEMASLEVSDVELEVAIQTAKEVRLKANNTLPINAAYVLSIVKAKRKAGVSEEAEDSWWKTRSGIDLKGRELQMSPKASESYEAFKVRLFLEINKRKESAKAMNSTGETNATQ